MDRASRSARTLGSWVRVTGQRHALIGRQRPSRSCAAALLPGCRRQAARSRCLGPTWQEGRGAAHIVTILTDIKPGNPAFRDEFFGPVVSFFRVKTEEAPIALANDSDFGLAGSVWTKDEARGKRVASQVDTGMMFVDNLD